MFVQLLEYISNYSNKNSHFCTFCDILDLSSELHCYMLMLCRSCNLHKILIGRAIYLTYPSCHFNFIINGNLLFYLIACIQVYIEVACYNWILSSQGATHFLQLPVRTDSCYSIYSTFGILLDNKLKGGVVPR